MHVAEGKKATFCSEVKLIVSEEDRGTKLNGNSKL